MKMVSKLIILFLFTICIPVAKSSYIPLQLKQFKETGKCAGCDLTESKFDFENHNNADLSNSLLIRINAMYASFYESNFSFAQMTEAGLNNFKASGSNFKNANLSGANLLSANLSSCDFSGANLTGANLRNANLARAVISKEQLISAKSLSCAIMPNGLVYVGEGDRC